MALPAPGELNRRIQIRVWADVPNGAFGLDQTFDAGFGRWAKHEPIHSLAMRAGAQTGEEPTDLFWVYYGTATKPADITATHVVEWDGRRYRVLDTIDVEGKREFTRISTKNLGAIT